MNEHPAVSASIGGAVLLLALVFMILHWRSDRPAGRPQPPTSVYFIPESSTDVNDLFVDDAKQVPPFDHNGVPAVRARVFSCDGGATLVLGYVEKYPDEIRADVEQAPSAPKSPGPGAPAVALRSRFDSQILVKKPGGQWVQRMKAGDLLASCPDGKLPVEQFPKK